jgi:hypothetical protein
MTDYYPRNLPSAFRCVTHPDREGVGICVSCRTVVCVECSTRVDRMNYCIRCLQAAEPAKKQENVAADRVMGVPLLIGSFLLAVAVFAAIGFALAILRHATPGGVTAG